MKWIKKGNIKGVHGAAGPKGSAGVGLRGAYSQKELDSVPHTDKVFITHSFGAFKVGDVLYWAASSKSWKKQASLMGPAGIHGAGGHPGVAGVGIHGVWSQAELDKVPKTDKAVIVHIGGFGTHKAGDIVAWHGAKENKWVKLVSIIGPKGDTGVVHYTDPGTF